MGAYVNANNAYSTLAGNITAGDTSFTLTVGGSFPVVRPGDWSYVTFQDTANNIEIVKITAHGDGTNSFTCVRGEENTIPRAWIVGDTVECRFTAGTVVTLDGVQTLTNKTFAAPVILFADGTLGTPGIRWANEPTTGFTRLSSTLMAVSINGVNTMHWQPGHTMVNSSLNMPNGGQITFYNNGGSLWPVLHANSANNLYVGHGGWANTYIYGAGAANVHVHGGGVALGGNVTGVTKAMVGLGNVHNRQQIQELRPGGNSIYMGWNGSQIDVQVDNSYFGGTWPINISGSSASTSGNAATAGYANNSGAVNGISGWNYSNRAKNPVYLWATDGGSNDQYLTQPGNLNVNYANSSNYANTAGNANALGGVGPGSFVRTNDGSVTNLRVWQDWNDTILLEVATQGNWSAVPANSTFSRAVTLFSYGPTMADLTSKVEALEAKVAALEARA